MEPMRIVFWGTPAFSLASLALCHKTPEIHVIGVVTQPDKAVGRSRSPIPSPIKIFSRKNNIPLFQPAQLKKNNFLNSLGAYDMNVIVAYGKIVPTWAIDLPKYKSINLHPSLLPHYRGPSPIQYAILNGDTETGVSIILIDAELDHGPILTQSKSLISEDDTYMTLQSRLSKKGAELLASTIISLIKDKLQPQTQDHSKATFTKLFTKKDGEINWSNHGKSIHNQVRALNPWPGTYTKWNGTLLKILETKSTMTTTLQPGTCEIRAGHLFIGTSQYDLQILTIQKAGKTIQKAEDFIHGNIQINGSTLAG